MRWWYSGHVYHIDIRQHFVMKLNDIFDMTIQFLYPMGYKPIPSVNNYTPSGTPTFTHHFLDVHTMGHYMSTSLKVIKTY